MDAGVILLPDSFKYLARYFSDQTYVTLILRSLPAHVTGKLSILGTSTPEPLLVSSR